MQPSFSSRYWALWFFALALWLISSAYVPLSETIGWFGLAAVLGGYVFPFELGRLMGFLKINCPDQYIELHTARWLETMAFIHPALLRKLVRLPRSPSTSADSAFLAYRSAWIFSFFNVITLLLFANTLQ